jgi:transcriptional regulator with GAF, ATPase, and Fis domain
MRRAAQRTPAPPPPSPAWEDSAIIGEAPAWRAVVELIAQVADTRAEVLLLGESGTGKELVAKAVHAMSPRASEPFIAVNCAAIPANLLESDLFGHKKGAFTGAIRDRAGRFKEAHRGTIFLDEIGELPLGMQAKLLRVLQEKRFTPVGSDHDESADFRVVAATNIDLQQMVADGAFREDLFHRLYVFPVRLPPLRDRRADIAALAAHFLDRANAQYGRSVPGIAAPVMVALRAQQWPGNVRQLENIINRLVIIARDVEIAPSHLPIDMGLDLTPPPGSDTVEAAVAITAVSATVSATVSDDLPASGIALRPHLIALENRLIDQALARTDGNRNQAARLLGLNRTTLVEKLRKRGI